jgi:hypothetical protein
MKSSHLAPLFIFSRASVHPRITPLRALALLRRLCSEKRESQQIPGFNYTRVHIPTSIYCDIESALANHVANAAARKRT